jgi:hypothetical protein
MAPNADDPLADPPQQLRAFVRDGKITAMPARRTRRRLLLDQVVQAFEPGRTYPEATVNEVLKVIFDDYCALRRYLVDELFLSRTAAGTYWRAGGTVG